MQTNSIKIGQKIKRYRLINDIRQEDMAEKMGVSRATLINYEKGHTAINVEILDRIKNHYPDFNTDDDENIKPKIITNNTIDFTVLSNVLYQSKVFILFFTTTAMLLGIGFSYILKEYYEAEVSFYPAKEKMNQGLGQLQSIASNFGVGSFEGDKNFDISDVAQSRLIASKVVQNQWSNARLEKISLVELWKLNRKSFINISKNSNGDSLVIFDKAVKKLNDHIKVNENKISGLIKITTTFQDPFIAADIANFISREVESYIQKENSAQSTKQKIFISERLLIVKNELESSEINLKEFVERNRGYEDSPDLFMKYSQLFREVEAKKAVYVTLQNQLELVRIEEVKRAPILHILDYAVPAIKKSYPNRKLFLSCSFILGLIFSSILIIFRY